jgi:hypothetical protein
MFHVEASVREIARELAAVSALFLASNFSENWHHGDSYLSSVAPYSTLVEGMPKNAMRLCNLQAL